MRFSKIYLIIICCLSFGSCSTTKEGTSATITRKPVFSLQLGSNKGGMVENTDMTIIEGTPIDAFTGATRNGVNAGARISYPLTRRLSAEAGIDFMNNGQTFTLNDPSAGYTGVRKFSSNQFMLPTTLNISMWRKRMPGGIIQLKIGHLLQYNLIALREESGNLPQYTLNKFSNGLTFGINVTPFRLKQGHAIGFFIEGYRGTRIYEDYYNREDFVMPGSAFVKYGIFIRFN